MCGLLLIYRRIVSDPVQKSVYIVLCFVILILLLLFFTDINNGLKEQFLAMPWIEIVYFCNIVWIVLPNEYSSSAIFSLIAHVKISR